MSKLGGGDLKSGITSAAINETIINEIGKIKDPALQQWVSYIIGSAVAEAVGGEGTSGGSVAASGTKNNWLLAAPMIDYIVTMLGITSATYLSTPEGRKLVDESGEIIATFIESTGEWLDESGKYIGKSVDDLCMWAKKTAKEKANDVPSWARGDRPRPNESGKDFAKRLMDEKYGPGNYKTGPGTEYNKLRKWGDRGF